MAIIAGIDEAGYGPTLGPLVVSGTAFRVPDRDIGVCLWERLAASCARTPGRSERRLVIADSKRLFRPRGSFAPLERAALVMLAVGGSHAQSWPSLLRILAPGTVGDVLEYPWYSEPNLVLPRAEEIGDVGTRANAVRRDCRANLVAYLGATCEILPEGHFNRLIARTRNKAVVLLGLALRVASRLFELAVDEPVRVYVDRLGGRTHYREPLATAFPHRALHVLQESDERSAYRLTAGRSVLEIEFATRSEGRHFPVALASVYSKYLRELAMHAFNAYWSERSEGLKPTAGYYTDAHRWLRDAEELLQRLNVDRRLLVRER